MIRTALKLGFRVVAYEPQGARNSDERERGQARNLIERILKDAPQARILVHAGYAHIDEKGADRVGVTTMAQRFKEATGIDPLTIEQTEMSEHGAREDATPALSRCGGAGIGLAPDGVSERQGRILGAGKGPARRDALSVAQPATQPRGRQSA